MLCLFNKKSVGIDIADHKIWITRLVKTGGISAIDILSGKNLEPGVVVNGRIKNKKALAKSINELMKEIKAKTSCEKRIVFGLPKNQAFIHVFSDESGKVSKKNIDQIVKKDIEESVPLEANDLYYTYKILSKKSKKTNFLAIAVSKKIIREWQDFFESIGIDVQIYDLACLATFRNLYKKTPKKPLCMIDIGGDNTSISIFNNKGLSYSHAIKIAGQSITSQISKDLKISIEEAEKTKLKGGLGKGSKILPSVKKAVAPIIKTTKEIINYSKEKTGEDIEKIILVGGTAQLKGLTTYFKSEIGIRTELGKPIITKSKADFEHLNSIGLALRGLEGRTKQKDPGLSPLKKQKKTKVKKITKSENLIEKETETGAEAMNFNDMEEAKKLKKQKITLLFILLVGVILVSLSLLYRNNETKKKQLQNPSEMAMFSNLENVSLQIPIAIHKDEYTSDRVKGRITETIENKLKSGEKVWLETVAQNPSRWLIYSETEAQSLLLAKIKNDITPNFSLNNIKYTTVSTTDNRNIYYLNTDISIYTAKPLPKKEEKITPKVVTSEIEELSIQATSTEALTTTTQKNIQQNRVTIKKTPFGWLNVRSGAGTEYPQIAKVNTQEKYNVIGSNDNWTEIDLGDNTSGWVFNNYIETIKE